MPESRSPLAVSPPIAPSTETPAPGAVRHGRLGGYLKTLAANYLLTLMNVGTHVVSIPLYLQWLGSDRYGFWLILLQLLWAVSFVTAWIAPPLAREAAACHVSRDGARLRRLFWTSVAYYASCGAVTVAAAWLLSPILGALVGLEVEQRADARMATVLAGVSFAVSMQLNLLLSLLTGYQRMHLSNLLLGAVTMLSAAIGLALVYAGGGIAGAAAGHLVSNASVGLLALLIFRRVSASPVGTPVVDLALLKAILMSGSGYFAYGLSYLLLQSDILLIGFLLGPSAAAVYGVAFRAVEQVVYFVWKIPDSLFPITAELSVRGQLDRLQPAHRAATRVTLGIACLAVTVVVWHGNVLLALWIGATNAAPQPVLAALAAVLVAQAFVHASVAIPFGASRMGRLSAVAVLEGFVKLGLALMLVPHVGMAGAALATVAAQALCTGWYAPLVACRLTGDSLPDYLRAVVVPLLPATLALGLGALLLEFAIPRDSVQAIVTSLAVGATYVALYVRYAIQAEEREWIRRVFGAAVPVRGTRGPAAGG